MTPRRALHFAAIAMAVDSHCADKCSGCHEVGMLMDVDMVRLLVCPHCHGFGTRELRPAHPSYTFAGVAMGKHSILNMEQVG